MRTSKLFINLFLICSSFLFGQNSLSLSDNSDGTWDVGFVSDTDISGFQFTVDDATISAASGGDAEASGMFTIAPTISGGTITTNNFVGAFIASGSGTLVVLTVDGTPTGLSSIIVTDASGADLGFSYDDGSGCTDSSACNYDADATSDDDSCLYNDCAGECGGSAVEDECGVCNGDGADEGFDCDGNCADAAVCGSAALSFGAVTDSSVEILYDSNFDVGGFQFTASGVELTGASSSLENVSLSSATGVVVGFSLSGASLAAGSGSLAVLEFAATSAGSTLDVSNVVLGAGSEGIMSNIMRTFLTSGDKIISSMNSFIGFKVLADASGYEADWVPMKDYTYDLEEIANRIDTQTKIIYLANPDNPTGTYFNKKDFDSFMSKVPERVLIILDEAYYEYANHLEDYPDSMLYRYDNVITLRTFSKVYGLAGFRVGYGFAHSELISNLLKVKLPFEPSSLSQEAALAALDDHDFITSSMKLNLEEKKQMYDFLNCNKISYIKSATNFITIVFKDKDENKFFSDSLLNYGVIIRNLTPFGISNCSRVTIGTPKENKLFKESCLKIIEKKLA